MDELEQELMLYKASGLYWMAFTSTLVATVYRTIADIKSGNPELAVTKLEDLIHEIVTEGEQRSAVDSLCAGFRIMTRKRGHNESSMDNN